MRQSRFTETEIVYAVKQVELGILVREIARKYRGERQDGQSPRPVWSSGNCSLQGLFCTLYGTTFELPPLALDLHCSEMDTQ